MIKLSKQEVFNIEGALRGMRNPMNSWDKADSDFAEYGYTDEGIGSNDMNLCKRLINAGTDHRKFMRQIMVCVDIEAPLYWWKEYDTYKVGTTANSTSTMHKIHSRDLVLDDFSHDKMDNISITHLELTISHLNRLRSVFIETKDKKYWYSMIQLLPSGFNQTRTCTLTYENLLNMYIARRYHKLDEWRRFCEEVEKLPYMMEFIEAAIWNDSKK